MPHEWTGASRRSSSIGLAVCGDQLRAFACRALATINASAAAERGLIVHRVSSGYLSDSINTRLVDSETNSRHRSVCHPRSHLDRPAFLVKGRPNIEHMQDGCDVDEESCHCEVASGTYPASASPVSHLRIILHDCGRTSFRTRTRARADGWLRSRFCRPGCTAPDGTRLGLGTSLDRA